MANRMLEKHARYEQTCIMVGNSYVVGVDVGPRDGRLLGLNVGLLVGAIDGHELGLIVGSLDGAALGALSRKELQKVAKAHGVRANMKSTAIIAKLMEHQQQPMIQRSCGYLGYRA